MRNQSKKVEPTVAVTDSNLQSKYDDMAKQMKFLFETIKTIQNPVGNQKQKEKVKMLKETNQALAMQNYA